MRVRIVAVVFTLSLILPLSFGVILANDSRTYEADILQVRTLFERRQYSELNDLLESYQTSCDRDFQWESAVQDSINFFHVVTPSYKKILDEWVQSDMKRWPGLLARANYYYALGLKARGGKLAKDTSDEQFNEMTANLSKAASDIRAALQINQRLFYGYCLLIGINQSFGDQKTGTLLVENALKISPDSYVVRRRHIMALVPRWGGSYEAMEQFAKEAIPNAGKNPLLKTLPGFIFWDQADMSIINKKYQNAVDLYERALTYGPNWDFLFGLAKAHAYTGNLDNALTYMHRAIAIRPNFAEGYGFRSKIFFLQEKWDEAMRDLQKMEQVGGWGSDELDDIGRWESGQLVKKGHGFFKTDLVRAIEKYDLAVRFFPANDEAYCWRGVAYNRTGNKDAALVDLRKAISLNPRLYRAYVELDSVLLSAGRLDEIIELWTQFLDLEPTNANAYLERAGTYYHKRDFASSLRDATKACELGNAQACQQMKSIPK